jgi:PAS domain S-box-containing protein
MSTMYDEPMLKRSRATRLTMVVPIIERVLLWLLPLSALMLVSLIVRDLAHGLRPSNIATFLLVPLLYLMVFLRRFFSPRFRLTAYCLFITAMGLEGLANWGLAAQGSAAIILALILASMGGLRFWATFLCIGLLGTLVVAWGYVSALLKTDIDVSAYMQSPASWAVALLAILLSAFAALLWNEIVKTQVRWSTRLEHLLAATSGVTGERFFENLTRELAGALGVKCVMICETARDARQMHTIACCYEGESRSFEWQAGGSVSRQVLEQGSCWYPEGLQEAFPEDAFIKDLDATSCRAERLCDSQGRPRAVLAIVDSKPLRDQQAGILLKVMADRAAAELSRMQTQQELQKSDALLRAAIDASPAGILIADAPDVRIRIVNPAALEIRGAKAKNLTDIPVDQHSQNWQVYRPDGELFEPEELPLSKAILQGQPQRDVDAIIRRPNGESRWVSANAAPVLDPAGNVIAGLVVFLDITERQQARRALEDSEQRYRALFEFSGDAILLLAEGRVVDCNSIAEQLYGLSRDELVGQTPGDLSPTTQPGGRLSEALAREKIQAAMTGKLQTFQWRHCDRTGRSWDAEVSLTRVDVPQGALLQAVVRDVTGRNQADRELRQALARQEAIFEGSTVGIFLVQEDRIITMANRRTTELLGFERDDLVGRDTQQIHPSHQHFLDFGKKWYPVLRQKGVVTLECPLRRKDGEVRQFFVSGRAIAPPDLTQGTVWVVDDITERKQAERALRETQEFLHAALTQSTAGILIVDATGKRIRLANAAAARIIGREPHSTTGTDPSALQRDWRLFREDGSEFTSEEMPLQRAAVAGEVMEGEELRIVDCHGMAHWISVNATPIRNAEHEIIGAIAVFQDITENRQVSEERACLVAAVENAVEDIVVTDRNGVILYVNPGFEAITGYSREEAIGHKPSLLKSDRHDRAFYDDLWATITTGNVWTGQLWNRRKDDRLVCEESTISPIHNEKDEIIGYVAVKRDVTEHLRMQEMVVQSEKMLSVGGLAAGMAHEINNPLGGILQGTQNIERRLLDDLPANVRAAEQVGLDLDCLRTYVRQRKLPELLKGIREAGERAAEIVANMLRFSRPGGSHKEKVSVCDVLDRAIELARIQYDLKKHYDFRHVNIFREYERGIPCVICNPTEIEQVILNLLTNAAQALAEKAPDDSPEIILRAGACDGRAWIEVEDNGPGIADAHRTRVFEPFFTTKDVGVGTGLGLSVSYFIITQNHNGTMEVLSTPGEGSTFRIELPAERT